MDHIALFRSSLSRFGDRIAIATSGGSFSFATVQSMAQGLSPMLAASGVRAGDRVAVWSRNTEAVLLLHLASLRLGAVWCPVSAHASSAATVAYLRFIEPCLLLCGREELERGRTLMAEAPDGVCLSIDALMDELHCAILARDPDVQHCGSHDDASARDDTVALIPTGGTTSAPRAVCQSRVAFEALIETLRRGFEYDEDAPVCLTVSPLSHSAGAQALAMWTLGASNIVMSEFSPRRVFEAIQRDRVTHMFLPPTALTYLTALPDARRFDCSSLRAVRVGGEPVAPSALSSAIALFGPCVCQTYGQIEAPFLTWMDRRTLAAAAAGEHSERLRSCGRVNLGVSLQVVDGGHPVAAGECGEIVVKGPGIPCTYYGVSTEPNRGAWHHTGDIGYQDEDGYVYLVGRLRDVIVTAGMNVYASDVEAAIMTIDGVRECAVVGVPDSTVGERVCAVVVAIEGCALSERDIRARCKEVLGRVRTPRSVTFASDLPKTPVGKIDKRQLLHRFCDPSDNSVAVCRS